MKRPAGETREQVGTRVLQSRSVSRSPGACTYQSWSTHMHQLCRDQMDVQPGALSPGGYDREELSCAPRHE